MPLVLLRYPAHLKILGANVAIVSFIGKFFWVFLENVFYCSIIIFNALSAIAAYCFFEKKPAIEVEFINDGQLTLFCVISNVR